MRNAMRFIQNSTTVELAESVKAVEKLLRIILESSQRICEYMDATKLGDDG